MRTLLVPGPSAPNAVQDPTSASRVAERLDASLGGVAAMHRHLCPRQVLGVRMGLHAGELLGVELPRRDKRLLVFVETDGCFADAISVATGCWLGHRTLRLIDHGKIAVTVADTITGGAVRVWPHPSSRARAGALMPQAPDRWHAQLEGYQVMPASDLLVARPVTLAIDLNALRSRPGTRVACAACGEEVINERQVSLDGRALCRACAGDGYFRAIDPLNL